MPVLFSILLCAGLQFPGLEHQETIAEESGGWG